MDLDSSNSGLEGGQSPAPESSYPSSGHQVEVLPAAQATAGEPGAGNIDKIRDILFGSNMRDYEQRFSRLEEALKKESSDLRDTTRRHLESLEAFVHKELAALEVRLNAERDERSAGAASILKKIGDMENYEAQAKR